VVSTRGVGTIFGADVVRDGNREFVGEACIHRFTQREGFCERSVE
jgi:hypothetical protein